jgi:hypothetical protein
MVSRCQSSSGERMGKFAVMPVERLAQASKVSLALSVSE